MSTEFHPPIEYGMGENEVAAAIIAGMPGRKPAKYEPAALALLAAGHDVVTYTYGDIFERGEPQDLVEFIAKVSADFEDRTKDHQVKRYTGFSLGAGVAYNMQKRTQAFTEVTLIAAGGTDAADNFFHNPLFKLTGIRKRFTDNRYSESDVREIWGPLQTPATAPIVAAYGGLDYVVSCRKALRQVEAWRASGIPVSTIIRPHLGHNGMQRWFIHNMPTMLHEAEKLKGSLTAN